MIRDLAAQRQFFAEEIEAVSNLRTTCLVDAFAAVPRERFLPPGPWLLKGEAEIGGAPRRTPDADPRRVYHNLAIAIDPARQLFNGSPALLGLCLDALALAPGKRVLHLGTGLGYYTAVAGSAVGPSGRVLGLEVDPTLASMARENLSSMPWVEMRCDAGKAPLEETFDAMLINAGVTHPETAWLDALSPGGRLILPITSSLAMPAPVGIPSFGPTIGKGPMVVVTRRADNSGFDARPLTFVAIYQAIGIRDESLNVQIGQALTKAPLPPLRRLRVDAHDRSDTCWLHGNAFCLSTAEQ